MVKPLSLAILCRLDISRAEPLPVQIYRDLLAAIRDGRLRHGSRLPASRGAAGELGVSRGTINVAYDLLRAEGVIEVRPGAAPRVVAATEPPPFSQAVRAFAPSARGARLSVDPRRETAGAPEGIMAPGEPSETLFPRDEWGRALRRAARRMHGTRAAYGDPHGLPDLRLILSERLAQDRGVFADPGQILITTGTQGSLSLATRMTSDPHDLAAIEDPGYLGARVAFEGAGLRLATLPVDEHGARPDVLPEEARLIYLTPSNQYPTGVRLSHARRRVFLDRAEVMGALILEDDYDSEFHWRGREIAALAAEGPEARVIYAGSAAKVLMPALRIGWLVVPDALVDPFRAAARNCGLMANLHAQAALAEMMRSGRYRAQLGRIARVYAARGLALAEALDGIDGLSVRPPDGGVQLAIRFEDGRSETEAIVALSAKGFSPSRLSRYMLTGCVSGLVVGFADATPERIALFVRTLIETPCSG
ncbi:GntR family transcriptional regulator/MocR family aminotransferase [Palleronia aestuarii]|uniref:GntR family transcriptional regulator/MocR family aminotransferase n=1 Tax=Palleronia aestuarii TaxID=568105 RepID=A0A2W7N9W2_9RHOB|nr:PLP-dependent aminotransferase family protein [Palleronia aestuarii]PZX13654.1 GntR family transcriptional regulator/MocR family aminotransferase [Palleronia aestuarii]